MSIPEYFPYNHPPQVTGLNRVDDFFERQMQIEETKMDVNGSIVSQLMSQLLKKIIKSYFLRSPQKIVFFLIPFILCSLAQTETVQAAPALEIRQSLKNTSVVSGTELQGRLHLKNTGDEPLKILGVSSSCGCTTIRLRERLILPAKELELRFVVDTRGKLGLVEKTITLHTDAPDSPHTETIHFHAQPSAMSGNGVQAIFDAPCAECHLDSGSGKTGKPLYDAVCAMCHPDGKLRTKNPQTLQMMISSGILNLGMPAYSEFLTKLQIQSLTRILTQKASPKTSP